LYLNGYGFSVPPGATIDGFELTVDYHDAGTDAVLNDLGFALTKNGAVFHNSTVSGGSVPTLGGPPDVMPVFGTSADLWGTTWTPAEVNGPSFGAAIQAFNNSTGVGRGIYNVDAVTVTVHFTPIPSPEVDVFDGAMPIADGGGPIDFGAAFVGQAALSKTFTVQNNGATALATSGLSVPASYSVPGGGGGLVASIPASSQDTFIVVLSTVAAGTFPGTVSFMNDDSDENPYNFTVTGTISPLPSIAVQPVATNENPTQSHAVMISATASDATSLQWQFQSAKGVFINLANGGNISGADTDTLTIDPVEFANSGTYQLVATNGGGSATSAAVSISVAVNVPTLSESGRILLLLSLFAAGAVVLTRKRTLGA
jgi:hypothetical protein